MNNRILVFGDSIVWGAWDSQGGWVARLKKYTDKQAIEGKEDYDSIYLLGISGDNSDDLLKRFEGELMSRLDDESSIHIVIAIGVNDSQCELSSGENRISLEKYVKNLSEMVNIA